MTQLVDDRKRGLPPPPAPVRRGSNPWKLSDTARKPEAPRAESVPRLLEDLMAEAHAGAGAGAQQEPLPPEHTAPAPETTHRRASGLLPLIFIAMIALFALRMLMQEPDKENWIRLIGPALIILFIAHGWWKQRQRRRESRQTRLN
jgi:hypothetical protein